MSPFSFCPFSFDSDTEVPIYFLDPHRKLGMAIKPSGKSAASGAVAVRLETCGSATARIVDRSSDPLTGPVLNRSLTMVLAPGLPYAAAREKTNLQVAYETGLNQVGTVNYPIELAADLQGRLTLPVLIPKAIYRVVDDTADVPRENGPPIRKEFTVKPGEIVDLGDILIEKPRQ